MIMSHIYFINVFVAKLGTAATGNFLSGKRERERERGGELQAVNYDTVEATYCDHFGMDIN
jgi:hypothetical protein